jgi:hypothetical protein
MVQELWPLSSPIIKTNYLLNGCYGFKICCIFDVRVTVHRRYYVK